MGAGTRRPQAAVDAGRVGRIQGEEMQQALGVQLAMTRQVVFQGAGDQQRHGDFIQAVTPAVLGHQRQRIADIEHARQVFDALQIARHPIQIRGSST